GALPHELVPRLWRLVGIESRGLEEIGVVVHHRRADAERDAVQAAAQHAERHDVVGNALEEIGVALPVLVEHHVRELAGGIRGEVVADLRDGGRPAGGQRDLQLLHQARVDAGLELLDDLDPRVLRLERLDQLLDGGPAERRRVDVPVLDRDGLGCESRRRANGRNEHREGKGREPPGHRWTHRDSPSPGEAGHEPSLIWTARGPGERARRLLAGPAITWPGYAAENCARMTAMSRTVHGRRGWTSRSGRDRVPVLATS